MIFDKTWRLQRIERKIAGKKAKLQATRELVNACERSVPGALVCDMRNLPQEIAELETRAKQLQTPNVSSAPSNKPKSE